MKKRAWYFLWISLAGILIFYLWAFLILFRKSFFSSATGTWRGMKNYRDVLGNQAFWMAMKNTCFFLVVSILVLLLLSLFVARILLKNSIVNRIVKKGLLIPFAVPAGAVVFLWNLFFDVHGILNGICSKIGGAPMHWMECKYAMYILVLVYVWKNLGYYVILWTVALNQISESATEAAKVDGAGAVRLFFSIQLPQMKKPFLYILLFAIMSGFKMFREAYVVTGEYPAQYIYMIQNLLNNWYRQMEIGKFSAASGILVLFLVMLTAALYLIFRERGEADEI